MRLLQRSALLLLFACSIQRSTAQTEHELNAGFGVWSAPQYLGSFIDNTLVPVVTLGLSKQRSDISSPGVPFASWMMHPGKRFSYGAEFVADRFTRSLYDYESNEIYAVYDYDIFSLLARADCNYINSATVRLYSSLAMGVSAIHYDLSTEAGLSTENRIGFALNCTLLGVAFKTGRHLQFFAETNAGNKPLFAAGIGYRL